MMIDAIQQVAVEAAYRAGDILKHHFGNLTDIRKKGTFDLVTQADLESERCIIAAIRDRFPRHGILAEESGAIDGDTEALWVIDPLDGTTNFAHQLGIFCISIAFVHNGEPLFGLVFNPVSAELFTAIKGKGAWLNNHPMAPSTIDDIQDSLLVTGFTPNTHAHSDTIMARFARCVDASQSVRRLGSAALDLCFVACGRFEGFWEEHLKPWDTAAGALIVEEAGGVVSNFDNAPYHMDDQHILATNGKIHTIMISLLDCKDTQ